MECVSIYIDPKKGNNEISIRPVEGTLVLDFIDITPLSHPDIFAERLTSRNTTEENAYSVVIPSEGYYKLSDLTDDSLVTINGCEITGGGNGLFGC